MCYGYVQLSKATLVTKPVRFYLSVKKVYQHKPEAVPLGLGLQDYSLFPLSATVSTPKLRVILTYF